jgi:hypothetical protein
VSNLISSTPDLGQRFRFAGLALRLRAAYGEDDIITPEESRRDAFDRARVTGFERRIAAGLRHGAGNQQRAVLRKAGRRHGR